jgi:hypothetical protein
MALLTKAKANHLLQNDFVYYWDNAILKKQSFSVLMNIVY